MKVGFAGAGRMAAAMARGWASADGGPELMLFSDLETERASRLAAEVGGEAVESNPELAERADLLVLAVKPKALEQVAAEAGSAKAVLSLLGATSLAAIVDAFPDSAAFRTIPNQAVEVHRGVLCFAAAEAPAQLEGEVRALLELLGLVIELDDALFDAATAAMSVSPAFLALAVESIAEASTVDGMEPELARSLVVEAAAGTAELLRRHTPAEVRGAVASPGGITEAGLEILEREGAADAFKEAIAGALARMRG